LTFTKERSDLFNSALARMGYRLVPTRVAFPTSIVAGTPFKIESRWMNRGVGRALRDYEQRLSLVAADGQVAATASGGSIQSSKWAAGGEHNTSANAVFRNVPSGSFQLAIGLHDDKSNRDINLPLAGGGSSGSYRVGNIRVTADKPAPDPVR
jgi:hypothetical protein